MSWSKAITECLGSRGNVLQPLPAQHLQCPPSQNVNRQLFIIVHNDYNTLKNLISRHLVQWCTQLMQHQANSWYHELGKRDAL